MLEKTNVDVLRIARCARVQHLDGPTLAMLDRR
jgi:hypothetical protein